MLTLLTEFPDIMMSGSIPDLGVASDGDSCDVHIWLDAPTLDLLYSETFFPQQMGENAEVWVHRLPVLVEYAMKDKPAAHITIEIYEYTGGYHSATITIQKTIIRSKADIDTDAETFFARNFFTKIVRQKTTALGRVENLFFMDTAEAKAICDAIASQQEPPAQTPKNCMLLKYFDDGTEMQETVVSVPKGRGLHGVDVSPNKFTVEGKKLTGYYIQAGQRGMRFQLDHAQPDVTPMIVFQNSFGVEETFYSTGERKSNSVFTPSTAVINGAMNHYYIKEVRSYVCDTGPIPEQQLEWIDELYRSPEVYLIKIVDGAALKRKKLIITDSKTDFANSEGIVQRSTFTYQLAQLNHNIIETNASGQIFDDTFDSTFD